MNSLPEHIGNLVQPSLEWAGSVRSARNFALTRRLGTKLRS
uniref:Uncharacterized protein n=1 Tax=Rhizobium rhizogenes TaxID=359 RepID=A0A7S5DRY3_RHIRH|nr:hypothetical protein pC5.8b_316 [Rhizobium rhizogenes]